MTDIIAYIITHVSAQLSAHIISHIVAFFCAHTIAHIIAHWIAHIIAHIVVHITDLPIEIIASTVLLRDRFVSALLMFFSQKEIFYSVAQLHSPNNLNRDVASALNGKLC